VNTPSGRADIESARAPAAEAGTARVLRATAVVLGLGWSVGFVLAALVFKLHLYGDGAIFSYAVAVQDSWAIHWRNIAVRSFVHLFSHVPAELYIAATGDAAGGAGLYGLLFFSAPLVGLALTFAADRSPARTFFVGACLSTALVCPLVFGCPTETWFAHALFWPTLALCHCAPVTLRASAAVFAALTALIFTHEGGLIFAGVIVVTLALRGLRDPAFMRAAAALTVAATLWGVVKFLLRPDDYIAPVLAQAAFRIIDVANFDRPICRLMAVALAFYALLYWAIRRFEFAHASWPAGLAVVAALAVHWLGFDDSLHAEDRYVVRTILLIFTPVAGLLAAVTVLVADDKLPWWSARLGAMTRRVTAMPAEFAIGALVLLSLINAVETAKFLAAWTQYMSAVRTLATGTISDPALGDASFVSSARIPGDLDRLAWNSTTPYLSVMLAPGLLPARLVVDPRANYFWLSCETASASASERASRAVPAASRRLVRVHACLHPHHW
jgi:hypothetical protein